MTGLETVWIGGWASFAAWLFWYQKSGRADKDWYKQKREERQRVVSELRAQGFELRRAEEEPTQSIAPAEGGGSATAQRLDVATSSIASVMLEGMPVVSQDRRELADYIRDELRKDPEGVFLAQTDGYLAADALDGFNDEDRPEGRPPA